MAFAGIAYKTDGQDATRLEAEVEPLVARVQGSDRQDAGARRAGICRGVHERYLGVLVLYEEAAQVTLRLRATAGMND